MDNIWGQVFQETDWAGGSTPGLMDIAIPFPEAKADPSSACKTPKKDNRGIRKSKPKTFKTKVGKKGREEEAGSISSEQPDRSKYAKPTEGDLGIEKPRGMCKARRRHTMELGSKLPKTFTTKVGKKGREEEKRPTSSEQPDRSKYGYEEAKPPEGDLGTEKPKGMYKVRRRSTMELGSKVAKTVTTKVEKKGREEEIRSISSEQPDRSKYGYDEVKPAAGDFSTEKPKGMYKARRRHSMQLASKLDQLCTDQLPMTRQEKLLGSSMYPMESKDPKSTKMELRRLMGLDRSSHHATATRSRADGVPSVMRVDSSGESSSGSDETPIARSSSSTSKESSKGSSTSSDLVRTKSMDLSTHSKETSSSSPSSKKNTQSRKPEFCRSNSERPNKYGSSTKTSYSWSTEKCFNTPDMKYVRTTMREPRYITTKYTTSSSSTVSETKKNKTKSVTTSDKPMSLCPKSKNSSTTQRIEGNTLQVNDHHDSLFDFDWMPPVIIVPQD